MKLYEISNDYRELFEQFEMFEEVSEEQAWFDTLDGIEQAFDSKAESIAVYIKNLTSDIAELKAEEKALKDRRQAKERKVDSLKKYLLACMQKTDRKKIDCPKAVISVRTNAESVCIADERAFIDWAMQNDDTLLKHADPEIKKNSVKSLLQGGKKIPYATLQRTQSLLIK